MPGSASLCSARTTTTYRPCRSVMILILEGLGVVPPADDLFERRPQSRALAPERLANLPKRRRRLVAHFARRQDGARDRGDLGREVTDVGDEGGRSPGPPCSRAAAADCVTEPVISREPEHASGASGS